jgi:hypothetical protein
VTVTQHALTVVAPVRPDAREALSARLDATESAVQNALASVETLHFARFVLLDGNDGPASKLAFESNHDGEQGPHIEALARALAPFEDVLFGAWEGYRKGQLASFVEAHALPASTFYLGHPGLTVRQIVNDRELRTTLETLIDEEHRAHALVGESALAIRERLLARVAQTALITGPVDRDLPMQPFATLWFYALVVFVVFPAAVVFIPLAFLAEWRERKEEPRRELVTEDDPRLDPINRREDAIAQNGLTHYVPLRPGSYRQAAMRVVLWFLERARRNIAYEGTLGGISSIHFARWVLLEDGTVLFFSNYDGSWEAYLGDFVDKAHFYLTAVWTNTKWFPVTHGLVFAGASKEATFKQWTRTFQVENRIWYSAYKNLTVSDVLRNAVVREGASAKVRMNEREAREWLGRL